MCFFAIIYFEDTDISTFVAYKSKYQGFMKNEPNLSILPVLNYGFC